VSSIAVREVEVRSWPERADLVVIDYRRALVVAQYSLSDPRPYVPWQATAPYEERARAAVELLEADQDFLRLAFDAPDGAIVKLTVNQAPRQRIADLLGEHGITMGDVDLVNIRRGLRKLAQLPVEELYGLLCDWYDVVERRYPAGSARQDPSSWVTRAHPDRAVHHHYLVCGAEDRDSCSAEQSDAAYELFRGLIDVELPFFSFGHAIRWVYYLRTEFSDRDQFALRALSQVGV
jgi:hypothetical protein